jgi:UrcA family protein
MFVRHLIITAAALFASTVALSTIVHAEDARIVYHASELTTDAGRQAVIKRIHRAANLACGFGGTLEEVVQNKKCVQELSSQMVAKLGAPELAAPNSPPPNLPHSRTAARSPRADFPDVPLMGGA